ncbi:MAG TPA: glycine betaine ABC transporter substrate-binding protein [Candidatus Avamphibacillus sp.]|nr:glycine betaine ABC transporter substrate-binding protein [Candidatus Avamphibacillus sp.]
MLTLILAACGDSKGEASDSESGNSNSDEELVFGLINWPENIAVNHVWKVLLEEEGYEVDIKQLEMGTIMEALSTGDLDVGIEVWLPVQDISYYEEYKDTVDFNETPWFENGKVGLVVPEYIENINSVEDLNDHKELFEGEIIGFEPGAGTMEITELLIEDYNLDFELVPSSEAAMLGALREAVKREDPIVVPLWQPHGIFSELDLKFLDDPKKTYGEVEEIYLATRDDFAEDYPEVNEWLSNWSINDDETMAELINFVYDSDDPLEGAKEWVEENRDLTDEWMN